MTENEKRLRDALTSLLAHRPGTQRDVMMMLDALLAEHRAEVAARERSEADNAALLGRIHSTKRLIESGQPLAALADIEEDERHGLIHPGAALLEYQRALERVLRDAVTWMKNDAGAKVGGEPCRHSGSCKWQRAEAVLVAAADALKGKP